jgi:hypothetical protein
MLEVLREDGDEAEDIETLKKQLPRVSAHLDDLREEVTRYVEGLTPKKTSPSHLRLVKSDSNQGPQVKKPLRKKPDTAEPKQDTSQRTLDFGLFSQPPEKKE